MGYIMQGIWIEDCSSPFHPSKVKFPQYISGDPQQIQKSLIGIFHVSIQWHSNGQIKLFFLAVSTEATRRKQATMMNVESRLFTHAGSRIVRQTSLGVLNRPQRLTGSSKDLFRTRTRLPPTAAIIRFQNEWWIGEDGSNPSYCLTGRKIFLPCISCERPCHERSAPQEGWHWSPALERNFSFLWCSTWSASAFGLSTPALR